MRRLADTPFRGPRRDPDGPPDAGGVAGPAFVVALLATLSWADERMVHALSRSPAWSSSGSARTSAPPAGGARRRARLSSGGRRLRGGRRPRHRPLRLRRRHGAMIPVNKFSLAGHVPATGSSARFSGRRAPGGRPNPFTGFDPADDFPIAELASVRPLHVTNATLNMVGGTQLGRQERKAEPFTLSPLHAGRRRSAYRPAAQMRADSSHGCGITLGTAITISGRGREPLDGHVFDAGADVPHDAAQRAARRVARQSRAGRTRHVAARRARARRDADRRRAARPDDATGPYVYLSDGGHFDNLGLVEMVRRRCRFIVVSRCGCGSGLQFDDLANAVRRIRIDLGVRDRARRHRHERSRGRATVTRTA